MLDTITTLAQIDANRVAELREIIAAALEEQYPQYEVRRGVTADLVLELEAVILAGIVDATAQKLRRSFSLQTIEEDPTLADDALVDAVLSNFRLARRTGTLSRGTITVVVKTLTPIAIFSGAEFTANGVTFVTESAYTAKPAGATFNSPTDVPLVAIGGGNYAFSFPVVATVDSPQANLKRGTRVIPDRIASTYVTSYAESDFSGGLAEETNAELLVRLQEGAAVKAWSDRVTNAALIRSQPSFTDVLAISIVGAGDAEMSRDRHALLPISGGGRSDVYVQTAASPAETQISKSATLLEKLTDNTGLWQISFERTDLPGFYELSRIALPGDNAEGTGFEITSFERGFYVPDDGLRPDIVSTSEAAFSAYQTATVVFNDTTTDVTALDIGDEADYNVAGIALPLIGSLQAFFEQRDRWPPQGDVLVRAPVPCFLTIQLAIRKSEAAEIDEESLAGVLAAYVNKLGFRGYLYGSELIALVHATIPAGAVVAGIDMLGRIRVPDDSLSYIRDSSVLLIPDDPDNGITSRTTLFFLDAADVRITISTGLTGS